MLTPGNGYIFTISFIILFFAVVVVAHYIYWTVSLPGKNCNIARDGYFFLSIVKGLTILRYLVFKACEVQTVKTLSAISLIFHLRFPAKTAINLVLASYN